MTNNTTAPAGYTPQHDDEGNVGYYQGPTITRPGFTVQSEWVPGAGYATFIDHEDDRPFTENELDDLVAVLHSLQLSRFTDDMLISEARRRGMELAPFGSNPAN